MQDMLGMYCYNDYITFNYRMVNMKIIFYLPLIIARTILWNGLSCNFLTRIWFRHTYRPTTIVDKNRSENLRNSIRLAEYNAKILMRGNRHE